MNLADLDLAPGYRRFWWVLPPAGMAIVLFTVLRFFVPGDGDTLVVSERINQTFPMRTTGTVRVENFTGDISIMGQRDTTVLATIVREGRGDTEREAYDDLTRLESRMERQGDTITIRTWREPGPAGLGRPTVQLTVPYGTRLELVTGQGNIVVNWVRGPIAATTSSGDITLTLAAGQHFLLDGSGKLNSEFELDSTMAPVRTVGAPADAPHLDLNAMRGTVRLQKRTP